MKTKSLFILISISLGLVLAAGVAAITARPSATAQARPRTSTNEGGVITHSTTWDVAGSPYILTQNVIVTNGVTLTIDPGVVVQGNSGRELQVLGDLEAVGTPELPITFTSSTDTGPEQWSGLFFDGGIGYLRNVTVRYGGYVNSAGYRVNIAVRNVQTGAVSLESSRVITAYPSNSLDTGYGLYVDSSHVTVSDTLFSGCGRAGGYYDRDYPVYIAGANSAVTLTGNTFTANGRDVVGLDSGAMMAANATLTRQPVFDGYQLQGSFIIPAGRTLTVEPGVRVKGRSGFELKVQGDLEATGTATQPIIFTSDHDNAPNQWAGLVFDGGVGHLRYATVRYGGQLSSIGTYANIGAQNVPIGGVSIENSQISGSNDDGVVGTDSHMTISHTVFSGNGSDPRYDVALYATGSNSVVNLVDSVFQSNTAGGVKLVGNAVATLINNAVIDPQPSAYVADGILVDLGARAVMAHNTIARYSYYGLHIGGSGSAILSNTLFSKNSYGTRVEAGGALTLTNTLWDQDSLAGSANESGHIDGPANFDFDGYHLTIYSNALNRGVNAEVTDDIDGDARPRPAGEAPDLGADEYPYSTQSFLADQVALPPQWAIKPDAISGNPIGQLLQKYLIRFSYGSAASNPPAIDVAVTDTLPAGLTFDTESHQPAMSFQRQSQVLTWHAQSPVNAGQSGEIQIASTDANPQPGHIFTNQATLNAGALSFPLQAVSEVPLVAPLITWPGSGETCTNTLQIRGAAQPGVTITLYANATPITTTMTDAHGFFTTTYNYVSSTVTLKTQACLSASQCSADSDPVVLTPPLSFWDPRRSVWEGTPSFGPWTGQHLAYNFRDNNGLYSTQNWVIPGVYGFYSTTLNLYLCTTVPTLTVKADGVPHTPPPPGPGGYPPGPTGVSIPGGAHDVEINNCDVITCVGEKFPDHGHILIDPDGYVFDVTKGLSLTTGISDSVTAFNTIKGVTVTAYVSMPEWGGWVPWPAQLYNNQINPQVTKDNGYFAFFTPPGYYYLQVDGIAGYQSWHSPVVQVITEIVHVNVPLTPVSLGMPTYGITLTPNGPSPATVTVPLGSNVQWISDLMFPPGEWASLTENPILRLLSNRNPLSDTLGFDGGLLAPGQSYRRQFTVNGTYTYSDGAGHTAQVIVVGTRVYLPLVLKSH